MYKLIPGEKLWVSKLSDHEKDREVIYHYSSRSLFSIFVDFGISSLAEANYFFWVSEKLFVIDCGTYDIDFPHRSKQNPVF